jgi:hypothetical protein
MALEWIKFELHTSNKPEVWEMAGKLGVDPDAVVGKLLRVWGWFSNQTTDGNAPSVTKALLDRDCGVVGFCAAMIEAGWMIEENGRIRLPNFDRHNSQTAKTRALTAKRVASHKGKSNAGSVTTRVSSALPREDKIREEVHTHTPIEKEIVSFSKKKNDACGSDVQRVCSEGIPPALQDAFSRWVQFRFDRDGVRMGAIQQEAVLMDLLRRGADKAVADINFSILKTAKSILDSANDFEKTRIDQAHAKNQQDELKNMTYGQRMKAIHGV